MLAFVSEQDGNPEIYLVRLNGTDLKRLTDDVAADLEPAWSPDGRRIAFASDRGGNGFDLYVMEADGSNVVRLTHDGSSRTPAWSPDGKKVAFSSVRDGQFGIYVLTLDGNLDSPMHLGHDRGWNSDPAWSPDGARIAFTSDWRAFDILYDVYVMGSDGSEVTPLLEGPFAWQDGPTFFFQPAWSPDGRKIAVVTCEAKMLDCYVKSSIATANADGSGLRTLADTNGYAHPTWSPDGRAIAFSWQTCPSCAGELRYVSADGGESAVIFANGHDAAWRP
jgi:TolB protein